MKPQILVVGEDGFNGEVMHFVINREYGNALSAAGALPLLAMDTLHAADYLSFCHGLFLTGGPDIHCARYGDIYESGRTSLPSVVPGTIWTLFCAAIFLRQADLFSA